MNTQPFGQTDQMFELSCEYLSVRCILTTPTQKKLYQPLNFVNFYKHAKSQAISFIFSGDTIDLKILQYDWLRAFWPLSQEQDFFQIWDV